MLNRSAWLAALGLGLALQGGAMAQAFPEKPITIVVTGQVGGTIDALTRQLAPYWEKTLGQKIVVDNRSQAAGIAGIRHFMTQPNDGHTIMICTEAHYSSAMEKDTSLKAADIELINMHAFDPAAFTVLETSRFKTLEDVVKEARQKPRSVSWGSPATGAPALVGKAFAKSWGLDLRFVPQAGGVESDTALMGGHVDIKVGTASGDATELRGARIIAVAAPERLPFLPDVPTINEVGAKLGLTVKVPSLGSARLIVVHSSFKAKYPERFQKLVDSYRAAVQDPAYQEVLKKTGQSLTMSLNDPAVATARFRELVENTLKYQQEFSQ